MNICKYVCFLKERKIFFFSSSKVQVFYLDIFQRQDSEWERFEKCWEEDEPRGSGQSFHSNKQTLFTSHVFTKLNHENHLNSFTLISKNFSHHMFSHDWIKRIKQNLFISHVFTKLNHENQLNPFTLRSKTFSHHMFSQNWITRIRSILSH